MKITKPPRYVDGIMVNERIVVEALNKYFFDTKAAKGPYPALYCDQCNHLDHWQPKGTEWKDSTRYVQIWKCLCGRETETGAWLNYFAFRCKKYFETKK